MTAEIARAIFVNPEWPDAPVVFGGRLTVHARGALWLPSGWSMRKA
jgi:hypothetical protein